MNRGDPLLFTGCVAAPMLLRGYLGPAVNRQPGDHRGDSKSSNISWDSAASVDACENSCVSMQAMSRRNFVLLEMHNVNTHEICLIGTLGISKITNMAIPQQRPCGPFTRACGPFMDHRGSQLGTWTFILLTRNEQSILFLRKGKQSSLHTTVCLARTISQGTDNANMP